MWINAILPQWSRWPIAKRTVTRKGSGRSFLNNFTVDFHDSWLYWLYSLECRLLQTLHRVGRSLPPTPAVAPLKAALHHGLRHSLFLLFL